MAQLAVQAPAVDVMQEHRPEVGVLILLVAIPVIWTALLSSMMGLTLSVVGAAVGLSGLAGIAAGFGREFYVLRIATTDRAQESG